MKPLYKGTIMPERDQEKNYKESIQAIKKEMGDALIILTHHYQRSDIVDLGDFVGDSFELSRIAANSERASHIVFCGVHFMAESAAILAGPHQVVQIPDEQAGCPMADMATMREVSEAWEQVASIVGTDSVTPVVYMNSGADLKAFCGRHGGLVCTSSNAPAALRWAFSEGEKIFFFPDQHLGRNTGNAMGLSRDDMIIWSPRKPLGGNSAESIQRARVILWDGYCPVHVRYTAEHVQNMRQKFPQATIVVHPECPEEVVALSDAVGSTGYIVKYVKEASPGATIVVGTEINLVRRLARDNPDKTIYGLLSDALCDDMFRIDLKKLLSTLAHLGRIHVVTVDDEIKRDARKALQRMLDLPPL
jgi:quinolinate synthase